MNNPKPCLRDRDFVRWTILEFERPRWVGGAWKTRNDSDAQITRRVVELQEHELTQAEKRANDPA